MLTEVLVRAGYQLLLTSAEVNNLNIIITEDMPVSEKVVFDDFLRKDHFLLFINYADWFSFSAVFRSDC